MIPTITFGIGIVAFLILFLSYTLDQQHKFIKIILIFFALYLMLLIAKDVNDNQNYCDIVLQNTTVTGNFTDYNYERVCFANAKNTGTTFFKVVNRIVDLSLLYMVLFTIVFMFFYYWEKIKELLNKMGFSL